MSVQVNATIVRALVQLRGLSLDVLAQIAHIPRNNLARWVVSQEDEAVTFEQKLEVLNYLGIRGELPRGDVVHYWSVREGIFSSAQKSYGALRVVLDAFGPAKAVHLRRELEPVLSFSTTTYFGLQFETFSAMLRVDTHPLRSVSFAPGETPGVTWAEATSLDIPAKEYDAFEPGALQVATLEHRIMQGAEQLAWDKLRATALNQGLRAEQVAAALLAAPSYAGVANAAAAGAPALERLSRSTQAPAPVEIVEEDAAPAVPEMADEQDAPPATAKAFDQSRSDARAVRRSSLAGFTPRARRRMPDSVQRA